MSDKTGWKDLLVILLMVIVLCGFLALAAVRTADLYYKAGWIAIHFPPQGTVCTELFCLRTDTSKPEPSFPNLHFAYCPDHLQSGFQGRGARSNGIVLYQAIFVTLLSFVTVPLFGALFRIAAWPVLIPLRLSGKLPPGHLLPFTAQSQDPTVPGAWLETAGMWTGAAIAIVAIILYCWW